MFEEFFGVSDCTLVEIPLVLPLAILELVSVGLSEIRIRVLEGEIALELKKLSGKLLAIEWEC